MFASFEAHLCPACHVSFDQTKHLPRLIPNCAHTVCAACLEKNSTGSSIKCPIDGFQFSIYGKVSDACKENYALSQVLAHSQVYERCPIHKEKLRLVCLEDRCKVCDDCVHEGFHFGHKAKPIKKMQGEANMKVKRLEESLETYDKYWLGIEQEFEKTRKQFLKSLNEECENLKWLITMKEFELTSEINVFFDQERRKLRENLNSDASLKTIIYGKIADLNDVFSKPDFLDILEEDITDIFAKVEQKVLMQKMQILQKGFQEKLKDFQTSFVTTIHPFVTVLSFPQRDLLEKAQHLSLMEDRLGFEQEKKIAKRVKCNEEYFIPRMEIESDQKNPQLLLINKEFLRTVEENLKKDSIRNNPEEIKNVLNSLWKKLQETSGATLNFADQKVLEKDFFDCCFFVNWAKESLEHLEVSMKNTNIKEFLPIPLLSEIIPRKTKLKKLSLNFSQTQISDKSLSVFPHAVLPELEDLKELELDFSKTGVTDHSMIAIFENVGHINKLGINLAGTQITDHSIEALHHTLANAKNHSVLWLDVSNTRVSDHSIRLIFSVLDLFRTFFINVSSTGVTNRILETLVEYEIHAINFLENFQIVYKDTKIDNAHKLVSYFFTKKQLELVKIGDRSIEIQINNYLSKSPRSGACHIDLQYTKIGDEEFIPLLLSLQTMSELKISLKSTCITDITLQALSEQVLLRHPGLEKLELDIANTGISDEGVKIVLANIGPLTNVSIDLAFTNITDAGLESFMKQVVSEEEGMKRFKFNLIGTNVTVDTISLLSQVPQCSN